MSFTISWKVALFLLLGLALIIFLALRYSSIFPGSAAVGSAAVPIPLPVSEKSCHYAARQMPAVKHQPQQRQHLPQIRTQLQQRQPPPQQLQQHKQQQRPVQDTDMGHDGQDGNEIGEDEEDPFFSPLN